MGSTKFIEDAVGEGVICPSFRKDCVKEVLTNCLIRHLPVAEVGPKGPIGTLGSRPCRAT